MPASKLIHPSTKHPSPIHHALELFNTNATQPTARSLPNHILQHILGHILAQLFGNASQIVDTNLAVLPFCEERISPLDLLPQGLRVVVARVQFQRRDGDKTLVVHPARVIRVDRLNQLAEFCIIFRRGVQGDEAAAHVGRRDRAFFRVFEFFRVDAEDVVGFLDLGFLFGRDVVFFGQFRAALTRRFAGG